ncbi:lipid A biosynthesis lauroyl acyltransferase [Reinekea forsetii]|uniref:Lipid A biosynthesis acyltransferase n=1 Tax=Reinekea forsetii TaxID=1336806 RepID=A0A2K8KNU7_9GAMM|nr:lipid A biosynthesis acyltransferase [Reinekea forsetii]ATX75561.1 lipid A biosynthesis lauroyl acyltransferase [Reinekea forsetii]
MRQARNRPIKRKNQKDSRVTEYYRFRDFWAPAFWPTWLGIAGLYLMAWLPVGLRLVISRALAALLYRLVASRRKVAHTNIRLCFPELDAPAQQRLVREVFYANILNFFETAQAWCRPKPRMALQLDGLEHLDQARATGRGVILLGGHFGPLDIAGSLFIEHFEYSLVYRKDDNPLFNYFMTRARERYSTGTIARKDMKGLLRTLKGGGTVWYAPDQDYGPKASVFVPFFGVPTATITMTSKLAQAGNALVLPISAYRRADGRGFVVTIEAPLAIPSGDEVADARTINAWLERRIREHPEQYLWLHKRFKTRPEGEPSVYQ